MPWFKGNLHCHTSNSDGRATPLQVGNFYRMQGHDFLGISDHNRYTPIENYAEPNGLTGIPCCEYSDWRCCHVLSIGVTEATKPGVRDKSNDEYINHELLQEGIDKTLAAGGIPAVCHPFWNWTLTLDDFLALEKCSHFEICNASSDCNAYPIPGFEPGDELWDGLLSAGLRYYGLATDDAHEYYYPPLPRMSMGGTGYNVVKIPRLTTANVIEALRHGHFYASTGIQLADYRVTRNEITIEINRLKNEMCVIQFFGLNGQELKRVTGLSASYSFSGNETYVRARIASSGSLWAWTQPVFLDEIEAAVAWTAMP